MQTTLKKLHKEFNIAEIIQDTNDWEEACANESKQFFDENPMRLINPVFWEKDGSDNMSEILAEKFDEAIHENIGFIVSQIENSTDFVFADNPDDDSLWLITKNNDPDYRKTIEKEQNELDRWIDDENVNWNENLEYMLTFLVDDRIAAFLKTQKDQIILTRPSIWFRMACGQAVWMDFLHEVADYNASHRNHPRRGAIEKLCLRNFPNIWVPVREKDYRHVITDENGNLTNEAKAFLKHTSTATGVSTIKFVKMDNEWSYPYQWQYFTLGKKLLNS